MKKQKYQWLVGRKVRIPKTEIKDGLATIVLSPRKVIKATPLEKDCEITFEEEADIKYLWNNIRTYNNLHNKLKQKKCNKEHVTYSYDNHIERYIERIPGRPGRVIEPSENPDLYGIVRYT